MIGINRYIRVLLRPVYYLLAQVIIPFHYERRYFSSDRFTSVLGPAFSSAWTWVVKNYIGCRRLGINTTVRWPVSPRQTVTNPGNITFDPNDIMNFQSFGCYFQAFGKITIGKGTYIAPNVGLITANHDPTDLDHHLPPQPIQLGEKCWIGMNAVILPGVTLGPRTVVGAGSVVTKSFPEGNCVIVGSPARITRRLKEAPIL